MQETMPTNSSQFPRVNPQPIQPQKIPPLKSSNRGAKIVLLTFVIILLLLLAGAVLVFALRIWDPLWNPFRPSPEKVVAEMFSNMRSAETFRMEADASFLIEDMSLDVNTTGSFEVLGKNPKFQNTSDIDLKIGTEDTSSRLEMKALDGNYYFKINGASQLLGYFGVDSNEIIDKWFKISQKDAEEYIGSKTDIIRKIKTMFFREDIYDVKEELADEKIGGKDVYHYKVVLDMADQKVADFFIKEMKREAERQGKTELLGLDMEEARSMFYDIGEIEIDLWTGKKDLLLYRLELDKDYPEEDVSFRLDLGFSDIDEPVLVEVPEDAKNLFDTILPMMEKEQKRSSVWSDMDIINTVLSQYEGDYSNISCLNRDIRSLCDSIKETAGEELVIKKSKSAFCAYVKVDDYYVCISSTNWLEKGTIDPSQEGYCDNKTFVCPTL